MLLHPSVKFEPNDGGGYYFAENNGHEFRYWHDRYPEIKRNVPDQDWYYGVTSNPTTKNLVNFNVNDTVFGLDLLEVKCALYIFLGLEKRSDG